VNLNLGAIESIITRKEKMTIEWSGNQRLKVINSQDLMKNVYFFNKYPYFVINKVNLDSSQVF
jgi:hypothetical protein